MSNGSMSNGSMSNGSMSNGSMSKLVEHSCQLTFFGKFSKKVSENRKNSSQLQNFYLKMTKNKKSYKKVSKKAVFMTKSEIFSFFVILRLKSAQKWNYM
jgi:hypothetical protein